MGLCAGNEKVRFIGCFFDFVNTGKAVRDVIGQATFAALYDLDETGATKCRTTILYTESLRD
jgi:hypothetical protein